ncbi:MAG: glucokinase [Chloroflexaceae bacterium]
MFLAGDVGGTTTTLAVYDPATGPRAPHAQADFRSADYPDLPTMVRAFCSGRNLPIERAIFAVAGPVIEGRVEMTNLHWVLAEDDLQEALHLDAVEIMNDLEALACAVPYLEAEEVETLHPGEPAPTGPIGVIAPGTGLGQAFLVWDGERHQPYPSEGGHADFAPRNEWERRLLHYLEGRFDHVSYERVCSGMGLPNIYDYLKVSDFADEPDWLTAQLAEARDPTPVIVNAALDTTRACTLCTATLNVFVSILGAEAGNLALKIFATGGVYLGGGMPPKMLPVLRQKQFLQAFQDKGRLSGFMDRIPVRVILHPAAAFLGMACRGLGL